MDLVYRPRRLRRTAPIRGMVRETALSPRQLIYPIFVTEGKSVRVHIDSMPGQYRLSTDELLRECEGLYALGVGAVNLFGYSEEKDELATKSYDFVATSSLTAENPKRLTAPTPREYSSSHSRTISSADKRN